MEWLPLRLPTSIYLLVGSIRFRLALWFAAILAVVLLAFSIFVYARQARDLRNETLDRLNYKTRKLEAYLHYGASDYFEKKRPLSPPGTQQDEYLLQENDILALVGLDGQVVQKVGPIAEADIQAIANAGLQAGNPQNPYTFRVLEAATEGQLIRENYLFVVLPISNNRAVIGSLILGSPVDPTGQLERLILTLVLGNLVTLGLALAAGYWLADRAMRPVKRITRTAREIGATGLSRRINLGTKDELGELANTFDEMLDRLKGAFDRQRQFTADASHELRTPLAIIGLEAGRALASRRSPPEYERALTIIQSENEWMARLVNNLLTLSRMDAGQAGMNFETLDLSDVALEVVERLAPLAERRGVALSTGDLPELKVAGDRQYLSQMIANLVENAVKYSGGGDPRVRVETGFEQNASNARREFGWVRVEDNGPGIAPEHLPHIFDRFYQIDRARSHNPEESESVLAGDQKTAGSGLGLSIVQWIAHAHGGEVLVESEANRRTVFTVRLPLVQPTEGLITPD